MKAAFSERFIRQYAALSPKRKAQFDKQLGSLLANLRHPSLRAKKYDESRDIWQARVRCNPLSSIRHPADVKPDKKSEVWRLMRNTILIPVQKKA